MSFKRNKIPIEWDGEWFESCYSLAKNLKVSTGRVSANLKNGWKLKGHYIYKSTE